MFFLLNSTKDFFFKAKYIIMRLFSSKRKKNSCNHLLKQPMSSCKEFNFESWKFGVCFISWNKFMFKIDFRWKISRLRIYVWCSSYWNLLLSEMNSKRLSPINEISKVTTLEMKSNVEFKEILFHANISYREKQTYYSLEEE